MAKIERKLQKIFGEDSGATEVAQFGSLAAGSPLFSKDPEVIQALANYLDGWFAAVEGAYSPAIEDMNALCYLFAYQLSYLFQSGIAEWNDETTYYIGSLVNDGVSGIFVSLIDDNTNNPITDDTKWKRVNTSSSREEFPADGTWTCPAGVTSVRVYAKLRQLSHITANSTVCAALALDGSAYTWGSGASGVSGHGNTTAVSSPVIVLGGLYFRQLTVGEPTGSNSSMMGLDLIGNAYAWGYNNSGQLGLGDVTPRSSPVAVLGGFKFRMLQSGFRSALGIAANGSAYGWGLNADGQLGLGDVTPRSSPVAVLGGLKFATVYLNGTSSYGLTKDGTAYAWGANSNGELGLGDVIPRSSPVAVLGGLKFKALSSGAGSVIGITADGTAYGWGLNTQGTLGVGDTASRSSPVAVLGGLKFVSVSSNSASVGISTNGAAYAWGKNGNGQLGLGDVANRSSPVAVLGGLSFLELVSGNTAVYGTDSNGATYAWGLNTNGQLGVGDVTPRSSPVAVLGGLSFQALSENMLNFNTVTVVPGQVYPVKVFASVLSFGGSCQYQSPYGNGGMPTKIVLEW